MQIDIKTHYSIEKRMFSAQHHTVDTTTTKIGVIVHSRTLKNSPNIKMTTFVNILTVSVCV